MGGLEGGARGRGRGEGGRGEGVEEKEGEGRQEIRRPEEPWRDGAIGSRS